MHEYVNKGRLKDEGIELLHEYFSISECDTKGIRNY